MAKIQNMKSRVPTGQSVVDALKYAATPAGRARVSSDDRGRRAVNAMNQNMVLEDAAYRAANAPKVNTSSNSTPIYNKTAILGNLNRSNMQTGTQEYVDMLDRLNASSFRAPAAASAAPSFSSNADYNAYYQGKQKPLKKGGAVKSKPASASKRADGIAAKGKTKGRMV